MKTEADIEPFALDKIKSHYWSMVKRSPYFCDMLYWMGRDKKADEEILKKREESSMHARKELARHFSDGRCTSLNVLENELKQMWENMVRSMILEKENAQSSEDGGDEFSKKDEEIMESWARVCDKAFDSIAVLLRIVDVIRNRQTLGRP